MITYLVQSDEKMKREDWFNNWYKQNVSFLKIIWCIFQILIVRIYILGLSHLFNSLGGISLWLSSNWASALFVSFMFAMPIIVIINSLRNIISEVK